MNKQITYKNHIITLDGITASLYYNSELVFKTRFTNASEAVKSLKAFVNLRLEQLERDKHNDKHISVYA